jgi:ArsR family metal-binding transcriptional regulator
MSAANKMRNLHSALDEILKYMERLLDRSENSLRKSEISYQNGATTKPKKA